MKEHPIIFTGESVRAILAGRKSQTRRIIKPQPASYLHSLDGKSVEVYSTDKNGFRSHDPIRCPYGAPGSHLWVREAWGLFDTQPSDGPDHATIFYRASEENQRFVAHQRWRPSIHMPRWASRLTLEVLSVRVERVQEISEEDAKAEGMEYHDGMGVGHSGWRHDRNHGFVYSSARNAYAVAWDSINGEKPGCSWADSPWVWVLEFKRIEAPQ